MATLIGRECWYVGATLIHGKIEKHHLNIPAVVIQHGMGDAVTVHATSALLTIDAAIAAAEDAADYWNRKVMELAEERDRRENAASSTDTRRT